MGTTATVIDLTTRIANAGERTRATVRALKGYRSLTDQQIADAIGWTRQKVQSYVAGPTKFTTETIAAFAAALDVPDHVLVMDKDDALRWVLDNSRTPGPDGPGAPVGASEYAPRDSNPEPADSVIVPLTRRNTRPYALPDAA